MALLSNIENFVVGNYYHLLSKWELEPIHVREQAIFRMSLCKDCLDNGYCTNCGCPTPNMFFSPNKEDPKHKWGKMMPPLQWEAFKRDNPKIYEILSNDSIVTDRPGPVPAPAGFESYISASDPQGDVGPSAVHRPEVKTDDSI